MPSATRLYRSRSRRRVAVVLVFRIGQVGSGFAEATTRRLARHFAMSDACGRLGGIAASTLLRGQMPEDFGCDCHVFESKPNRAEKRVLLIGRPRRDSGDEFGQTARHVACLPAVLLN